MSLGKSGTFIGPGGPSIFKPAPGKPPSVSVAPSISGVFVKGQTLTCNHGTWNGAGPFTYTYQWRRGGINIDGATSSTYTCVTADIGVEVECMVKCTGSAGTGSALSNYFIIGSEYFYDYAAALNNANSQLVRVICVGDSITGRYNATLPLTQGYDVLTRNYYQSSRYNSAQSGDSFYPLYKRATGVTTQIDSYWTLSNNGIVVGTEPQGPQGCQRFIENRNTCTIQVTGRYFSFFHIKSVFGTNNGTDRAYYTIDGGSPVYFDSYAAAYTQSELSVDMGTNAAHTLVFTAPISGKYFCPWGVEVRSKNTGVIFWNCGYSGAKLAEFKIESANGWITAAQPNLTIIPCNTNDAAGGTTGPAFQATLDAAVSLCRTYGSVLVVGENLRSGFDTYQEGTLVPTQVTVCTNRSAQFLNVPAFTGWTTLAIQNSTGNCTDGVHPTTQGHNGYFAIYSTVLPN